MSTDPLLLKQDKDNHYLCQGVWSIATVDQLKDQLYDIQKLQHTALSLDGDSLQYLDSAGALVLQELISQLEKQDNQITLLNFSKQHQALLAMIVDKTVTMQYQPASPQLQPLLYRIGKETFNKINQLLGFMHLIGDLCSKILEGLVQNWRRFRGASIVSIIHSAGLQALPILGLLSFLIGVVLAYQMGLQLQTYGASTFIAYLSGMTIFREFGPLTTAIIVAGRTSSSFTAQIGSMKINEEIDAIRTMGLSPTELLVLPKLIGLTLIFPLLIFWSDVFGVMGAMVMSKAQLHIEYLDYLTRIKESVGLKHLNLGLYKAPTFSIIIALVGCFQGFAVAANTDSIGSQTTRSVVQALFLIIIADATYSVVYSWMEL